MVRYQFHSTNAVYDKATRSYTFTLDRRIPNATRFTIRRAGYRVARLAADTVFPHMVYLRSDAIHQNSRTKHTVEATGTGHENASNIIVVLEETVAAGSYQQQGSYSFSLVKTPNLRTIDLTFSSGGAALTGHEALGGADDAAMNVLRDAGRIVTWYDANVSSTVQDSTGAEVGTGSSHQWAARFHTAALTDAEATLVRSNAAMVIPCVELTASPPIRAMDMPSAYHLENTMTGVGVHQLRDGVVQSSSTPEVL